MNDNKSVILCRVSTKEQEDTGYSLPAQEKFLTDYANRNNFAIAKVFPISESASEKKQREKFIEMMAYVEKHEIKIIIVEKVDRLMRNFKDMVEMDNWMGKDDNRRIHLVKDSLVMHANSRSQEKLNWGLRVLLAKNYIDNLSEEVKKGQKAKIESGWLPTKPPLGYKTTGSKGHKIHVIDETVSPFIVKMFELYSSGNYSLNKLVEVMYQEGLRTRPNNKLVKSRMADLLSDPFYCGKIRWKGDIYEGRQEPIISLELFNEVQKKLSRKLISPQYKKHLPTFKGKIVCGECGGTVTWETQKGHWYAHCNHYKPCKQNKYITLEKVEDQLLPLFQGAAPEDKRCLEWLKKALKESHADQIEYNKMKRESYNQIIAQMDNRMEKIYEDKLDGRITADFYEKKFEEYKKTKENTLNELSRLNKSRNLYYEAGFAIHELALNARKIYTNEKTTVEERRLLLSYAFSNLSLKDLELEPKFTLAFQFLKEWMPKVNNTFEPGKISLYSNKTEALTSACPALLPGSDSNRRPTR